jgi:hypothetical protein
MGQFSLTETSGLFLTKFQARSINHFNTQNVLDGTIKKRYDYTGKQMNIETELSFSGGVGAAYLPVANTSIVEQAVITAKKIYARTVVDRESLKAASSTEGAFQKFMAYPVKKTVESYARNSSRIMFGDGSGILGRGDGATNVTGAGTTGNPYIVTIRESDWNVANFEEQDYVQVVTGMNAGDNLGGTAEGGTATTNLLLVSAVNPSTRQISLVGTSPVLAARVALPGAFQTTSGLCMQRSYLSEPQGLKGVCMATSGSLYNINVKRRWKSVQENANGQGVVIDALNDVILQVEKAVGIPPKMLMMNYNQMRKILAQLEDQKVYNLPNANLKGAASFKGVEIMTSRGAIGMFVDRFCDEDKIYFLNNEHITRYHRPDFGWFDDDGTVFLRTVDEDSYEARYGGYFENLIDPTFQGVLYGLAK